MSLQVRELTKRFGGLVAVNGVSFTAARGELIGLIGPNGSGKTTLFNLISGVLKPDAGGIWFEGERVDGLMPHELFKRGIVRSFQIPRTFWHLTVAENFMLAPAGQKGESPLKAPFRGLWVEQEKSLSEKAAEVLDWLHLLEVHQSWGSEVSGGQMKLTEIGRAVMGEGKLVLLDEPAAGVATPLAHKIFKTIQELNKIRNTTFIIIEHRIDMLLEYVQRVIVMHEGKIIYDGHPGSAVRDEKVIEAYLGGRGP
ncbi:MAG: ABC transporter ATP-binding protein [Candidatus Caldarchaeum sp.]